MGTMINSAKTVSQYDSEKTGKTDKTYSVSNRDFLQAVFGGNLTEARPVVVSFKGNPSTVPNRFWFGKS